jgi:DNA-directed RNA polymerase subunit RPC12/RpoP
MDFCLLFADRLETSAFSRSKIINTDSMNFVIVQVYNNYIDANIIMGRLEEEGINCWLKDENTVTIDPMLTNAVGGIKLMVPESQAGRTFELLKQFRIEKKLLIKCTRCGSSDVELVTTPRKTSNWIGAIIGFLFMSFALSGEKVYHCFDCGFEFDEMPDKKIEDAGV